MREGIPIHGGIRLLLILMLSACGPPGSVIPTRAKVVPLAKVDGWRSALIDDLDAPPMVLEIAYDRRTAERAWRDNVPGDLEGRQGHPAEPGLFGNLDEVDFQHQVVVIWSSGESGTCPEWVTAISRRPNRELNVETSSRGGVGCTDDWSFYRVIFAVERGMLPDRDDFPEEGNVEHGVMTIAPYPYRAH